MSATFDFDRAFNALTGHEPFPWQRRIFVDWLAKGKLPSAVDIPTGLGKTAVMAVWLLARAGGAALPRRLVYVVDRRAVVDQATAFAEQLRDRLEKGAVLEPVRQGLGLHDRKLPISTLRGRYVDNREWMADPTAPAIIVGTVDMVGSRLLFEGYGVRRGMRPYAAGLMGCDTLVMLDEAHLARPFERLLQTIETEQRASSANAPEPEPGDFAGPAASALLPPPFRVLPLSATLRDHAHDNAFGLADADQENATVRARLEARKVLSVESHGKDAALDETLANHAWDLMDAESAAAERPARVAIYCNLRRDAEKVANHLRIQAKKERPETAVILFVGGRRVHEREKAAEELKDHGLIAGGGDDPRIPVFLVATSAGEVGVDLDADHMVCDLVAWERMVQRLGRVNRRGTGKARVLVIDQGPPDGKTTGGAAAYSHAAVRGLLEALPPDEAGGHRAGPAALAVVCADPAFRKKIADASTRPPLCPALTRPLIDAWAMTSLAEHSGRPEVGPWLRGWVEDEPQTEMVWRRYLPVRFENDATTAQQQAEGEIKAFFEAAPPHTAELLETETGRVADWLKKRAGRLLKRIRQDAEKTPHRDEGNVDDGDPAAEDDVLIAPMSPRAPIAFVLDRAGQPDHALSLTDIDQQKAGALQRSLAGRRLVVDARLCGIKDGLLDDGCDETVRTIEDSWGDPTSEAGPATVRVRTLTDANRNALLGDREASEGAHGHAAHPWRETLAVPYRVSPEGEATVWLVIEKRRGGEGDEEARAIARREQRLDEHQAWTANEAARIAEKLGLEEADRAMLIAAARHHDDGKRAPRWQRAFNAKRGGTPYAKTRGPFNRHVLNGYRHEFGSVLDAERDGLDGLDRSDPRFALALHLIAAHHGNARPVIGIEGCDDLPPSAAAARAHEIALRFARLQRRWGPWGLAWWEALLRAADQRASRALDERDDEAARALQARLSGADAKEAG